MLAGGVPIAKIGDRTTPPGGGYGQVTSLQSLTKIAVCKYLIPL